MARVLIVEDDSDLRLFLAETLTTVGHEVFTAPDGAEGLRALQETAPDLLLTDVMMPGTDGLELLQELHRGRSRPKIIVMSGAPAQWMVLDMAVRLGAHQTLAKPFTQSDLLQAVDGVLGR